MHSSLNWRDLKDKGFSLKIINIQFDLWNKIQLVSHKNIKVLLVLSYLRLDISWKGARMMGLKRRHCEAYHWIATQPNSFKSDEHFSFFLFFRKNQKTNKNQNQNKIKMKIQKQKTKDFFFLQVYTYILSDLFWNKTFTTSLWDEKWLLRHQSRSLRSLELLLSLLFVVQLIFLLRTYSLDHQYKFPFHNFCHLKNLIELHI